MSYTKKAAKNGHLVRNHEKKTVKARAEAAAKNVTPEDIATLALGEAVEQAKLPGAKTEIARALSELTGQNVTRQSVERWLHPEPSKRVQPTIGHGLALLIITQGIRDQKPADKVKVAFNLQEAKLLAECRAEEIKASPQTIKPRSK